MVGNCFATTILLFRFERTENLMYLIIVLIIGNCADHFETSDFRNQRFLKKQTNKQKRTPAPTTTASNMFELKISL